MELPRLQPLYEKYRDRGFQVVVIESQRDTEGARKFIEENSLGYVTLENGEDDREIVRSLFQVRVFPTSLIIDAEGRVVSCHIDFVAGDESRLEAQVLDLLG